jgi:nucleotide-binding universal stress UspA family protein
MFRKILHANDGSEHAFRALALALAIAKQNRTDLHIVKRSANRPVPRPATFTGCSSAPAIWQSKIRWTSIPMSWRDTRCATS